MNVHLHHALFTAAVLGGLGYAPLTAQHAPALHAQRCLGGSGQDVGSAMIRSASGALYGVGTTESSNGDLDGPGYGAWDAWLMKLSEEGELLEHWRFGGSGHDSGNDLVEMSDGGFVLVGSSQSTDGHAGRNQGDNDVWVFRVDAQGAVLWHHTFGGSGYETATAVRETEDGGMLVVAVSNSVNGDREEALGGSDAWVLKLSGSGELLWQRTLGGSLDDRVGAVAPTNDGGWVLAGSSQSSDGGLSNQGDSDAWLVRLNGAGELQWQHTYGSSGSDGVMALAPSGSGGFICTGWAGANNGEVSGHHGGFDDAWIFEVDAEGELIRQRCLGGTVRDGGRHIMPMPDGGYAVLASTNSTGGDVQAPRQGSYDYWLVRLNEAWEVIWEGSYGGAGSDSPASMALLADGSYVLFGNTWSSNSGHVQGHHGGITDAWLVITEPEGVSIPELDGVQGLRLTYDHGAAAVLVHPTDTWSGPLLVQVFSSTGALVLQESGDTRLPGGSIRIGLEALYPGAYIVTLTSRAGRQVGRFARW